MKLLILLLALSSTALSQTAPILKWQYTVNSSTGNIEGYYIASDGAGGCAAVLAETGTSSGESLHVVWLDRNGRKLFDGIAGPLGATADLRGQSILTCCPTRLAVAPNSGSPDSSLFSFVKVGHSAKQIPTIQIPYPYPFASSFDGPSAADRLGVCTITPSGSTGISSCVIQRYNY